MRSMKRYAWGLPMVVVALFAMSSISRPTPQGALAQETNAGAPREMAPDVIPPCSGPSGLYLGPYARAVAQVTSLGGGANCSSGFKAITHPSTGVYSLTLNTAIPSSKPATALTSIEWGASLGVVLFAEWNRFNSFCGGSGQSIIEVQTYKGDTGGVGSGYQIPVLDDHVAFTVVVP